MGLLTLESFVSSSLGLAVGAVAPSTEAALAMGPAVILIFVVFGGYYVNDKSVPRALQWIPRTSFIKHGFSGLCANELRGLTFDKDEKADVNISSGQQVPPQCVHPAVAVQYCETLFSFDILTPEARLQLLMHWLWAFSNWEATGYQAPASPADACQTCLLLTCILQASELTRNCRMGKSGEMQ